MSEVRGVVVAHGDLAACLVATAEGITGVTEAMYPISNADCGPTELVDRIRAAIDETPAILFVDLASGSCAHAARSVARDKTSVSVLTGVSLPVLLDFVFHRDMSLADLTERLVAKGHAGTRAYLLDPLA